MRGQQKKPKKLLGLLCVQLAGVVGMAEGVEEVLGGVDSKDKVGEVVQVLNHPCHSQWSYQVIQAAAASIITRTLPGATIVPLRAFIAL